MIINHSFHSSDKHNSFSTSASSIPNHEKYINQKYHDFIYIKLKNLIDKDLFLPEMLADLVDLGPAVNLSNSRLIGLVIRHVKETAPQTIRDKLIPGDIIIRINGCPLQGLSFPECQSIFVKSLSKDNLVLCVEHNDRTCAVVPISNNPSTNSDSTPLQELDVSLSKSDGDGFGFSLTCRDNVTSNKGYSPIYIKRITPQGVAFLDGRLRCGDRLIRFYRSDQAIVYDCDQLTYNDICSILWKIPSHIDVHFIITRQYKNNNVIKIQKASISSDHLVVIIPFASPNEPLGIDFRWHSTAEGGKLSVDCVHPGFAAARVNLLKSGDVVLKVNDIFLENADNQNDAFRLMQAVVKANRDSGNSCITFTIKRPNECDSLHDVKQLPTMTKQQSISRPKSCVFDSPTKTDNNLEIVDMNSLFIRDGVGRRSMSSKHTGVDDAHQFQFYRDLLKVKANQSDSLDTQSLPRNNDCNQGYNTMPNLSKIAKMQERAARTQLERAPAIRTTNTGGPLKPVIANHAISLTHPKQSDDEEVTSDRNTNSLTNLPDLQKSKRKQRNSLTQFWQKIKIGDLTSHRKSAQGLLTKENIHMETH